MDFNPTEKQTIALFFGKVFSEELYELSELYFLESGSVDHPSGDRLEVQPNGYIVSIVGDSARPHPYFYSRDLAGLYAALQELTLEIA